MLKKKSLISFIILVILTVSALIVFIFNSFHTTFIANYFYPGAEKYTSPKLMNEICESKLQKLNNTIVNSLDTKQVDGILITKYVVKITKDFNEDQTKKNINEMYEECLITYKDLLKEKVLINFEIDLLNKVSIFKAKDYVKQNTLDEIFMQYFMKKVRGDKTAHNYDMNQVRSTYNKIRNDIFGENVKAIDKQINSFREKQKYDLMNKSIERQKYEVSYFIQEKSINDLLSKIFLSIFFLICFFILSYLFFLQIRMIR